MDLTPGDTIVVYMDDDTGSTNITNFSLTKQGNADADNLLEEGEIFTIKVTTSTFGLSADDNFTIQIKPPQGAVIVLERRIPDNIEASILLP